MIFEICLIFLTIYVLFHFFKPRGNLPPGPRGFPLFGCFPYLYLKDFVELKKKYGNLFMRRTGAVNFLYICDYKLNKEALSKVEFTARPQWKTKHPEWERIGIENSIGIQMVHSRRFLVRNLRDLGMGKSNIEGIIMKEVEELVEDFKKLTKMPSRIPISLNIANLNIVWQLIASHRFNFSDKSVEECIQCVINYRKTFSRLRLPDFFPVIEYIIPESFLCKLTGKNNFYKLRKEYEVMLEPFIEDHLKTLDPNNPRDFMDEYLIELGKKRKPGEFSHFSMSDLYKTTSELFRLGSGSTATMTRWIITYMAKFQEIQRKIQQNIDRVVPRDSLPGLKHKNELAYLEATISEALRHSAHIIAFFRYTETDVEFGGYHIPKNTVIVSVPSMCHKDPTHFKDPDKFDPSRFLDENGKYIPTCDGFQTFGYGKKSCIGEHLARKELFLFTAALLQNFTFGPPDEESEISFETEEILFIRRPLIEQKFSIKYRK